MATRNNSDVDVILAMIVALMFGDEESEGAGPTEDAAAPGEPPE